MSPILTIAPVSWLILCCLFAEEVVSLQAVNHTVIEVPLLAFVPCLNATDKILREGCDLLIYPAILQAVEDINLEGIVIKDNVQELLHVKLKLSHIVTKVRVFSL